MCGIVDKFFENVFSWHLGVTRSREIESYRDYQERVQELKVLWKNEKLHATINKYIETLTFTRLQASCSQIVTFKMLTQVPVSVWPPFLYAFSFLPRAWNLPAMQIFFQQSRTGRGRPSSLH